MTRKTRHERVVQGYIHRWLSTSKQHCLVVYNSKEMLRKKVFDSFYIDTIVQKRFRQFNLCDAYVVTLVHYGLMTGRVAVIDVDKGTAPNGDCDIQFNNKALQQNSGSRFYGNFYGGNQQQDGRFGWKEPTEFSRVSDKVIVQPQDVPLEVGDTLASRTLLHLMEDRGLARWPYGSSKVRVYKVIDDNFLKKNPEW